MSAGVNHHAGTVERREELLRAVRAEVVKDHGVGVDLDAVAHRVGASRRQIQRLFQEHADQTFSEYLVSVRMAHARQLLAETRVPIGEVAPAVGYRHPAQFSKTFRSHHGVTPREFRRAASERT